jgi:methionyl-tRNA formyltransferase
VTRLALFGSGSPMSTLALATLAERYDVALVVVPGHRHGRPLADAARGRGIPVHVHAGVGADGMVSLLQRHRADLICVATYPRLLPAALLGGASLGAVGLHPSLLPRHRGPAPLFWTYHDGDADAGVSIFALDGGEDTGDVLAREAVPVERGRPGAELYDELARRGAALLARAVADVAAGRAERTPQDESRATREPSPAWPAGRVVLAEWDAERLWHFLRGVGSGFVADHEGRRVLHGPVRGWSREQAGPPGHAERVGSVLRLHCREGGVDAERLPLAARLRAAVRGGARA